MVAVVAERRKGRGGKGGWRGNSRPENRNFCSFHRVPPSVPHGRAIPAMALSIDSLLRRSARSIVFESALWYVASYYLVIMLRVGFLSPRRTEKQRKRES